MNVSELSKYKIPLEFIKKFKEEKIEKLYPPQEDAIKHGLFEGKNIVLSVPTAAGKTLTATLATINKLSNFPVKVVYIVPLVALANEKYSYYKKLFGGRWQVAISVGDLDSADPHLAKYDFIVCTTEKLDSLIRHGASWIKEIGLIIVDEVHLLNDISRGPTLEILITRLKEIVPNAQILALSATINNADELADWLDAELVVSNFRPVKLYEGVSFGNKIHFLDKEDYDINGIEQDNSILENTLKMGKQALFFVSSRRNAEGLAQKLSKTTRQKLTRIEREQLAKLSQDVLNVLETPTRQCKKLADCIRSGVAFHHAGLLREQKQLIEDGFRAGLIKSISATPTLAAGVNIPAFRVIIRDSKRYYRGFGSTYIPVLEYKQMIGRCLTGDTVLITEKNKPTTIAEIASKYFEDDKIGIKEIKSPVNILSLDLKNFRPTLSKITHIWKRKVSQIVEIETRSGKRLHITKEHPILTFTKIKSENPSISFRNNEELYVKVMELRKRFGFGPHKIAKLLNVNNKINTIQHWLYEGITPTPRALVWKEVKELKRNKGYENTDHLASLLGFINNSKPLPPNYFLPHEKIVKKHKNVYMTKQGHKSCSFPDSWSPELCRFIAKIMSNGSLYYSKKDNSFLIRYFNKNIDVQKEYSEICKKLFDKKISIIFRRGTYQASFKSFLVGKFLENIGVPHGKKSLTLRLPPVIFTLPIELIKSFIHEYVKCDGWETKLKYNICTCSEKLAYDFALLFSMIGMVARICKKKSNKLRKRDMWEISITKSQFDKGKRLSSIGHIYPDMIKNIKVLNRECYVYDLSLNSNHNFIANGIIVHNCGRPQYDNFGESILVARTENEANELVDRFIMGEPEKIKSKLAVEPVLRMHTLALVASGFTRTEDALLEFFSKTFYAYQYGEISIIENKLLEILGQLKKWKFISEKSGKLQPTRIGKRVTELYLDPLTAHGFIQALKSSKRGKRKIYPFSIIQCISNTIEMSPLLSIRSGDFRELNELIAEREHIFLQDIPREWDLEFDRFLRSVKTAMMFEAWINEKTEDQILDKFRVAPGELRGRLYIADWLIYSLQELALLLGLKTILKDIRKTRVRIKYGVRADLIPLVRLKSVGRIRARKLYNAGLKTISDLRKIPLQSLSKIIGPNIAYRIKEQLGERVGKQTSQKTKQTNLKF